MKRIIYAIFFMCLYLLPGTVNAQDILYVARNNPADGNDPAVIAGLQDLGYEVFVIGASELTVTSHLDYEPDLIFFGEYLSSSGVTPFADAGFPTPVISLEGYCTRSNRWALLASDDDFGQVRLDESYGIAPVIPDHYANTVIADHPIIAASGLSVGDEFAWSTEATAAPEVVWYNSMPQATATALTDIKGEAGKSTLWVLEPDANDVTNPIQHKMVIWGVHDNGLAAGTDQFWSIIDNSIKWALDMLDPVVEPTGPSVLYIARNNPADGNDPSVIAGLQDLGYDVIPISASEYTVTSHLDYEPDMIFFGEYLSSSGVTPFADSGFPVPAVSLEGYCTRSNRWALLASDDDFGQVRLDESYGIAPVIPDHYANTVIADHPIIAASGLSVGDEFTWSTEATAAPEVVWYNSLPQAAATALTDIKGEAGKSTLWAIEPDAADATNPLQHRLVIWGVHDNGLAAGTDEFWQVIDNSMKWVMDMLETTPAPSKESLLYVARNNPPDGNDPFVIDGLKELGYDVITVGASELTVTSHLDYEPDVIFFGEYLSSSGVTPFADAGFPTPCVSLEGYCTRSNRWALLASDDDFGQVRLDESYGIAPVIPDHYANTVIADHPIISASGLSVGDEFAWSTEATAAPEVVWYNSMPQAAATALTDIKGEAGKSTLWAIEPDAADATNPLQHRLVIWGVHDNGFAATTDDFWSVIDNSIQWVVGNLTTSTKEINILNQELTSIPNPFTTTTQIVFDLKQAATVELRVFDAVGRMVSSNRDTFTAGEQRFNYSRGNLQSGIYYYSLFADGKHAGTGKMLIK